MDGPLFGCTLSVQTMYKQSNFCKGERKQLEWVSILSNFLLLENNGLAYCILF